MTQFTRTTNPFGKSFEGLVNELFNDFGQSACKVVREDILAKPPVNITETAGAYHIEMGIPGYEKTDFNIKLDNKLLTISGEKKEEKADENVKTIRREFGKKAFKRSFTVDENIDAAGINARYENGILYITLPKKEEVKAQAKEITIQ